MTETIYLDYNATTPVAEEVLLAMQPYWYDSFANAASYHRLAQVAKDAISVAREQVAVAVGANPGEVFFTASGTESNNTIIKGVAAMSTRQTIGVSAIEHPCVLCSARSLQPHWRVEFIAVDDNGYIDFDDYQATLDLDCALISVMTANNETGVIQDIALVADMAASKKTLVHTDASQALGKIPLSFNTWRLDAMTISAHKCYGPKGVAALIVKPHVAWAPLLHGGGHQQGYRAGTENVAGIVGLGVACALATSHLDEYQQKVGHLRDYMEEQLVMGSAIIFGRHNNRLANTSYFGFSGIDGSAMVSMLDQSGICVTSGSACATMKEEPSHVLLAMGYDIQTARTAVRASLGIHSSKEEIDCFVITVLDLVKRLQSLQSVVG